MCECVYVSLLLTLFTQKLQTRQAALERSTANDHQKVNLGVLVPEFMSSKESDDYDSESEERYIVQPIPWRSAKVDDQLDEETKRSMSKQSKRQLEEHILSKEPPDASRKIPIVGIY